MSASSMLRGVFVRGVDGSVSDRNRANAQGEEKKYLVDQ